MITNFNGFSDFQLGHVFATLKDQNGKGVLVNFVICMALNKVFSKRRIFFRIPEVFIKTQSNAPLTFADI